MKKNSLVACYLDMIGVIYTNKYVNEFSKHPYNNNLYGIYKAAHLSDISEDCFPFITLLNHEFVIVKEINDGLL